jgi:hypothetical protein
MAAALADPSLKIRCSYFDYEGFRQLAGVIYTGAVPTIQEWDDINNQNGGSPLALLSTSNGKLQAYNGGATIDPLMLNYLKLFPVPTNNNLANNFIISPNKTQNYNTYHARVDYKFNEHNLFFGR